jgi:hypothetical protein
MSINNAKFKHLRLKYKLLFSDKKIFNCLRGTKKVNLLQYLIPFNLAINFKNIYSSKDVFKMFYNLRNINIDDNTITQKDIKSVANELGITIIAIKTEQFIKIIINEQNDQCSDNNLSFVNNQQEIIKIEKYNESQMSNEVEIYNNNKKMIVILLILSDDKYLICQDQSGNFIIKNSFNINDLSVHNDITNKNKQDTEKYFNDDKYFKVINKYNNILINNPQLNLKNINNMLMANGNNISKNISNNISKNNLYKFIMKEETDFNIKIMSNILINSKLK